MKTSRKTNGEFDSARLAVLLGLMVGLGIVVHQTFFLIAAVIAIGALVGTVLHAMHEHTKQTHLAYRPR